MYKEEKQNNSRPEEILPRFADDHAFAQLLVRGEDQAWEYFSREFRRKIKDHTARKYSNILGDVEVEEICDGVEKRLMVNDYKALREYRGECSLSTYITRATDWEIRSWLRKNSERLATDALETLDERGESPSCEQRVSTEEELPEAIKSLPDELRWAFLLRYYDDFDIPPDDIRRIAQKQGLSIREITARIVKYLEPQGDDILAEQRNKRRVYYLQLQKIWSHIQQSYTKERRLMEANSDDDPARDGKVADVRTERAQFASKREKMLKNKGKISITTPYEVIALILGEENVSTIRSRVFHAKKRLAERCGQP